MFCCGRKCCKILNCHLSTWETFTEVKPSKTHVFTYGDEKPQGLGVRDLRSNLCLATYKFCSIGKCLPFTIKIAIIIHTWQEGVKGFDCVKGLAEGRALRKC